jgi:hypothetical protein
MRCVEKGKIVYEKPNLLNARILTGDDARIKRGR